MKTTAPPWIENIALGKPASQSSVSPWSYAPTVEADAATATNGDTRGDRFFHTAEEYQPWWQVDLQGAYIIEQVRIYNRYDVPERLRRFTVLASLTGAANSWTPIYAKSDDTELDPAVPFIARPGVRAAARFIRIRKDDRGFLHFRECEVAGYPADPADAARIRQDVEQQQRRETDARAAAERAHAAGRTGYVTHIDAYAIFIDTERYSPDMVRALTSGGYEGQERRIVRELVRQGDRVLELGTAVGVVAMHAAAIVSPAGIMTLDANPAIVEDARRNFAANGMGEIQADVGIMRNRRRWSDTETEVDFFISRDFWGSRLFAAPDTSDIVGVVKVPVVCLEATIAAHRANVLICDIEGGEAELLNGADLAPIRLILMEIHDRMLGRGPIDHMMRYLIGSGFNVDFRYSGENIVVLDRSI